MTKPELKTWRDLEDAARDEPLVYKAFTAQHLHGWTREETLLMLVFGLLHVYHGQHKVMMDYLNTRTQPIILYPSDKP